MKNTPIDEAAGHSGTGMDTGPVSRKRAATRSTAAKSPAARTPGKKASTSTAAKRTRTVKSKKVATEPEEIQTQLPLQDAGSTAPEPAEVDASAESSPAPVKRKTARKPAARKTARKPAADSATPPADDSPAAEPSDDPAPAPPEEAARSADPPAAAADTPEPVSRPESGPPSHDAEATAEPAPRAEESRQESDDPHNPDGPPRRLTKWERWKQRKEKYKLMKQQRYLEKQGRAPGGGYPRPNGAPPQDGAGPVQERPPRPEPVLGPPEPCSGLLEISGKGFAFLRPRERGYEASPADPFVSPDIVRNCGLREGVWVEGMMRRGGRGPQLTEITSVNGRPPEAYRSLPLFEELTAINPNKRFLLETVPSRHTTRLIDFISPIGRGQRGLIVAAPRAGKTTFLQHIAEAILENYDDVKVIVVLVDERPEEVTEIARALPGAEIMASSNDQDPRDHIRMAHLAVERAKRLVEAGEHVFMVLDSITRLARAFNNAARGGGKAMSGGVDSRALEGPRRLFASARNTREAGSLTIVATALVETNNKGDELIFQEFKGTGNMELVLDRKIAQQYIYPAVDIFRSGTRREELLLPPHQLEKVHLIRRGLAGHKPVEAVERLLHFMNRFPSNAQMLVEIKARE